MDPRTLPPSARHHRRAAVAATVAAASFAALTAALASAAIAARQAQDAKPQPQTGWVSLFNGKNLDGWTPKIKGYPAGENFGETFRVQDGAITVSYDKYTGPFNGRFGHLFYKQKFSDYRLRIEYRFVGEQATGGPGWALRNSGVMIHSQSPESMRRDQDFPVSLEVQFLGGNSTGQKRSTGNLCTPGTVVTMNGKPVVPHCVDSRSKTYDGDQWVTAEVEVRGGKVRHFINGAEVLSYEKPELDENDADAKALIRDGRRALTEGFIALQSESHPVQFRKVEILPLTP